MYFHFLSLNFSKILLNIIAFQRWITLPLFGVGRLVSNQPTVNFVSRFIQTKKRNSFRSFSFYLAWEIRSWQFLTKTIIKHALFFPLKKKIILLRSDLIHNDFMQVLFISWQMNRATVILITTVIINNHNISEAPERHSLLIF